MNYYLRANCGKKIINFNYCKLLACTFQYTEIERKKFYLKNIETAYTEEIIVDKVSIDYPVDYKDVLLGESISYAGKTFTITDIIHEKDKVIYVSKDFISVEDTIIPKEEAIEREKQRLSDEINQLVLEKENKKIFKNKKILRILENTFKILCLYISFAILWMAVELIIYDKTFPSHIDSVVALLLAISVNYNLKK